MTDCGVKHPSVSSISSNAVDGAVSGNAHLDLNTRPPYKMPSDLVSEVLYSQLKLILNILLAIAPMLPSFFFFLLIGSTSSAIIGSSSVCSFTKNDYSIEWFEENGDVVFDLKTKAPKNTKNWWTAVGFGDGHNAGLDVLMVIVENGTIIILDRKSVSYGGSVVDDHQDVTLLDTTLFEETLHVQFSRPMVTNDPQDNPIDKCAVWAFPYSGGPNTGNWKVTQHFEIPERRQICDVAINCKRSPTDNSFNISNPSPSAAQSQIDNSITSSFTTIQSTSINPLPIPFPLNGAMTDKFGSFPFFVLNLSMSLISFILVHNLQLL